jgi:ribosomal protein S18 acetylase RimI-like enzyme
VNLSLRDATADDEQFLFDVYASTREEELAGLGWDEDQKLMFIRMQFLARERSYPRGGNQIITLDERPIGRMLVERNDSLILLRDIALLTQYRNRGLGTSLIQDLMKEATASGRAIQLHVLFTSAAVHLYERLGFRKTGEEAAYFEMRWVPDTSD